MEEPDKQQHHHHVHVTNVIHNRASARASVRRPPRRRRRKFPQQWLRFGLFILIVVILFRLVIEIFRTRQEPADERAANPKVDYVPAQPAIRLMPPKPRPLPAPADGGQGQYFLMVGEKREIAGEGYSRVQASSDFPIEIDFGDCHSSPTREYDCETEGGSILTLTDKRLPYMPQSPRNEVKVVLSR